MDREDFKRVYDKVQLSKEADDRILKELLEGRGSMSGRKSERRRGRIIIAAAVLLVVAAGGIFAAGKLPGFMPSESDKKLAVKKELDSVEKEEWPEEDGSSCETLRPSVRSSVKEGKGWKRGNEPGEFQLQSVAYPVRDGMEDLPEIEQGYLENLLPFYKKTFQSMLAGKKGENQLYSPINLYFTLAMMAEMTEGESREQLMGALGQEELQEVRKQSEGIWQRLYSDEKNSRCILGNSLWAKQGIQLNGDTLRTLSDNYYASTYQGQMGSKAFDRTIQEWLNKMTGGNLKEYVGKIETKDDTALMLLSAADFYESWENHAIDAKKTKKGTFYAGTGKKVDCDFMTGISNNYFYRGEDFTASSLEMSGGRDMYFFLPDKDSSVENLLQKDMDEILRISSGAVEGGIDAVVTLQLPKFQIDCEKDTIDTMKDLGVTDIFIPEKADFSAAYEEKEDAICYVGEASQAMQVNIDEKGCSASAYSRVAMKDKAGMIPEEKEKMRCDRPFLFVISDGTGIPIFAGVVNQPKK